MADPALRESSFPLDLAANPDLVDGWLDCQVGSRISRTNPPAVYGSGPIDTLIEGWSETIGPRSWMVQVTPSPAGPWQVAEADGEQRAPADGSTLASALSSNGTTLMLMSTPENDVWTTDPADMPLDMRVGGEQVTASAIGPAAQDPFTRTVTGSWGIEPVTGQAWQHFGSAASFNVTGSSAQHIHQAVNSGRISVIDIGSTDARVRVTGSVPVAAIGPSTALTIYAIARFTDDNNYYQARLAFIPNLAITCSIRKRVAGVDDTIASVVTGLTHVPGTRYTVELDVAGSQLRARVWREGDPVPDWQTQATNTELTAGTKAGVRTIIDAGSGNTMPLTYTIDDVVVSLPQRVTVTRGVNGVVRDWPAGTEVDVWAPAIAAL
ncbi:hypothetical protein AB0J20_16245 [Micromonospora costi]|uniref:hypothetical protein n=1 Tax=Micromonospora costi TaxID=1530042 RepID=UPI0033DBE31D